jgi:hypothetical protein
MTFTETVLASALGALLAVGMAGVLTLPRPKAYFRRRFSRVGRLLGVTDDVMSTVTVSAREAEVEKFSHAASAVWNTLYVEYGQLSVQKLVQDAPWPDESTPTTDSIAAGSRLTGYCDRVCKDSGRAAWAITDTFLAFDGKRRDLSGVLRKWASMLTDPGFIDWLRLALNWQSGYHRPTLKLCWYLETSAASGNPKPDYAFLPAVRDALDGPTRFSRP